MACSYLDTKVTTRVKLPQKSPVVPACFALIERQLVASCLVFLAAWSTAVGYLRGRGVFSDMPSDIFCYLAYFFGMLQGNRTLQHIKKISDSLSEKPKSMATCLNIILSTKICQRACQKTPPSRVGKQNSSFSRPKYIPGSNGVTMTVFPTSPKRRHYDIHAVRLFTASVRERVQARTQGGHV